MQHDDDSYAFRGRGGQAPSLVVSIRESLLEDSRLASALGRSPAAVSSECPETDAKLLHNDQDRAGIVELSSVSDEFLGATRPRVPGLSSTPSDAVHTDRMAHEAADHGRSILARLLRSLVPGLVNLGAIVAVFALFTFDGHWTAGNISDWAASHFPFVLVSAEPSSDQHSGNSSAAVMQQTMRDVETPVPPPPPRKEVSLATAADLAATKSLLDELSVRLDQMAGKLTGLEASQVALGEMISALQSQPKTNDDVLKKIVSQNEQMAHDIAALQAEQQAVAQKITNIPRPRPKLVRQK